jgi:hypothetical protein
MPPTTRSQTAAAAAQTRIQFILAQMTSFQDLFWAMQDIEEVAKPLVGDTDYLGGGEDEEEEEGVLQWIDSEDEIGWDFRGPRRAFMLFSLGSSDYFVGIWVGDYVDAIMREPPGGAATTQSLFEQLPVCVFDLEQDDCCCCGEDDGTKAGNLRSYLQEVVDWCRKHGAALGRDAEVDRLQEFVLGLSEHCISDRGPYPARRKDE